MSNRQEGYVDGILYTAQRWRRLFEGSDAWVWVVSVRGMDIGDLPDGLSPEAFEELVRALMRRKGILPGAR